MRDPITTRWPGARTLCCDAEPSRSAGEFGKIVDAALIRLGEKKTIADRERKSGRENAWPDGGAFGIP